MGFLKSIGKAAGGLMGGAAWDIIDSKLLGG